MTFDGPFQHKLFYDSMIPENSRYFLRAILASPLLFMKKRETNLLLESIEQLDEISIKREDMIWRHTAEV